MDIIKSAYFSLCTDCKWHYGFIVCSNGEESEEFVTISKGIQLLKVLIYAGNIAEDEALEVGRQIVTGGLERNNPELDELFAQVVTEKDEFACTFFSEAREKRKGANPRAEERMRSINGRRTLN